MVVGVLMGVVVVVGWLGFNGEGLVKWDVNGANGSSSRMARG